MDELSEWNDLRDEYEANRIRNACIKACDLHLADLERGYSDYDGPAPRIFPLQIWAEGSRGWRDKKARHC